MRKTRKARVARAPTVNAFGQRRKLQSFEAMSRQKWSVRKGSQQVKFSVRHEHATWRAQVTRNERIVAEIRLATREAAIEWLRAESQQYEMDGWVE